LIHGISEHGNLVPITEDEEVEEKEDEEETEKEAIDSDESSDEERADDMTHEYADEVHDVLNMQHGLTHDEVDILSECLGYNYMLQEECLNLPENGS
jgi:hypothetical protein